MAARADKTVTFVKSIKRTAPSAINTRNASMDFTMYETLLQLPLFQGLGKNDITEILTKVKFHFHKFQPGEYICRQDEPCRKVSFLLSGTLQAESRSRDDSYTYCENLPVPYVIELYSLFGLHPRYHASYRAMTDVSILTIEKQYLLDELNNYIPCVFNFSNIICTRAQYLHQQIWRDVRGDLHERFIHFLLERSCRPSGYKLLRIKMNDLAALLGDRRINVSRMLNRMQDEGLVSLRRKEIEIPALEKLL